jgi:hypothetical protein
MKAFRFIDGELSFKNTGKKPMGGVQTVAHSARNKPFSGMNQLHSNACSLCVRGDLSVREKGNHKRRKEHIRTIYPISGWCITSVAGISSMM